VCRRCWQLSGGHRGDRISDRTSPFRHYIDTKSLSVDAQQIVRYTVVVKSSSGGSNVAYEGMRCTPNGSFRTYAYGSGGRFQPGGVADWRAVNADGVTVSPLIIRTLRASDGYSTASDSRARATAAVRSPVRRPPFRCQYR
jgi:hypothetical protein